MAKTHKKKLNRSSFSKQHLLLFILVFSAIGGFLIYKSMALSTSTANIWIDTNGGSCTRSASVTTYSDAAACGSFKAACGVAVGGDRVYFKTGNYPGESIYRDAVAGQSTTCNPSSQVTFEVPTDETVEFQGTWFFGDSNTGPGIIGPANIKIVGWKLRPNQSDADRLITYKVQNFHVDRLTAQQVDMGIEENNPDPADQNILVTNSDFSGCFGTLGVTRIACITRFGGAGITLRNNVWHDYHGGEGTGCTPGVSCPRGVALALFGSCQLAGCPSIGYRSQNITIENNRFYNIVVTPIRIQAQQNAEIRRIYIKNNWFGCSNPSDIYGENLNGSVAVDNTAADRLKEIVIAGNTMCGSIGGLNISNSGDVENWGAGSKLIGNIVLRGGPPGTCDVSGDVQYGYNLIYPFNEFSSGGNYKCDASEVLLPYNANNFANQVQGPTWGTNMNLKLVNATSPANNIWATSSCTALVTTDYDLDTRPQGAACDAGADEFSTNSPVQKQGDLNNDGAVDILDLSILLSNYGKAATASQGDINGDGSCTILDLSILLSKYGT